MLYSFPARAACVRVYACQAACQADNQRVAHGEQRARLAQHQRFGLAADVPERAAAARVQRRDGAIGAQHENAPAGHQRGGVALRVQLVPPDFAAFGQNDNSCKNSFILPMGEPHSDK